MQTEVITVRKLLDTYIVDNSLKKNCIGIHDTYFKEFMLYPASTTFHHHWRGGLYDHVLQVINKSIEFYNMVIGDTDKIESGCTIESAVSLAFVHDLEKLIRYEPNPRFQPMEVATDKNREFRKKQSSYNYEPNAMTAVMCAHFGYVLTEYELSALCTVEGGWSALYKSNPPSVATEQNQLSTIVHLGDMYSTRFLKCKRESEVRSSAKYDMVNLGIYTAKDLGMK